jgi:hypothetical protein
MTTLEEPASEAPRPTDASTAGDTSVSAQRQDDESWHKESYGCWAYCMDLSYVGTEPSRILELRTTQAHKRLLLAGSDDPDHPRKRHSIVHPKLEYQPRLPRTGSIVMNNWCVLGSVATTATAETSLSPTQTSASLADLDECVDDDDNDDDDDEGDDGAGIEIENILSERCRLGGKPEAATGSVSPCVWGYFVDSSTSSTPSSPSRRNLTDPVEASSRNQDRSSFTSYRRFMSKELAASARYEGFAPLPSAYVGCRRVGALRRVPAKSNLRIPPTKPT